MHRRAPAASPAAAGIGWPDVTIGIIAALPVEGAAVSAVLANLEIVRVDGDPNAYRLGRLDSSDPTRPHRVALVTLPQDNTRNAAAACTDLIRSFRGVRCVIVVGIAGGVPAPDQPERHVRLGDVVVAIDGVVDFGHTRQVGDSRSLRRPVDGLSVALVRAVNELRVEEIREGGMHWSRWLRPSGDRPMAVFARPPEHTDRLVISGRDTAHPDPVRSGHWPGHPKVHYGAIGSGDVLLRDERRRDELASEHRILAIEMEAAGVATGARLHDVDWFVVRGIADYCEESSKSDQWQAYASLAAAAYVRAILEKCRPWSAMPITGVLALVPEADRTPLITLLDRTGEQDLRGLWHAAAEDLAPLPTIEPRTVADVFDHLLSVNAHVGGLPPALALLEEVAHRVDESLRAELRQWSDRLARRMSVSDALRSRRERAGKAAPLDEVSRPSLIIQIVPDGIDADRCVAGYWIQYRSGPWQPEPGGEAVETLLNSVELTVASVVRRAERAWRHSSDPIAIEFLLPAELLNLAVEWWRTDLESAAPTPLCLDYDVALRSLERMRADHQHRRWLAHWNALWREPAAHRLLWGAGAEADLGRWNARLRFPDNVTSVVLSAAPTDDTGRKELDLALRAGVAVVLWDRRGRTRKATAAAIRQLTAGGPVQILRRLRRLRMEAAAAAPAEQELHVGRYLALLWDDPKRLLTWEGG